MACRQGNGSERLGHPPRSGRGAVACLLQRETPVNPWKSKMPKPPCTRSVNRCKFMLRGGDDDLDLELENHGYSILDPTILYAGPVTLFTDTPVPHMSAFNFWPPMAIVTEICGPKAALILRASPS